MSYDADAAPTNSPDRRLARRILIVGGVAGGASCAARLRRLDESVEIAVFDRGPYVAFANCGLPYYVGDVIADERTLLVASPEMFRERFNIEVHTEHRRHRHRPRGADDRRARSPHRQQPHRALRRAGPVTGRGADPAAAAGSGPAWGLRGAQHSGLAPHPFLDCRPSRQHRGRRRRRIHRIGDGREPDPSRTLRDGAGKAAAGHAPARSGGRGPTHGAPDREGRAAPSRRRAGPHRRGGGRPLDRGRGERRQLSSRSRHPRHRRATRDRAGQGGRPPDRFARRHRRRCADAHVRSADLGGRRRRRSAGRA